MAALENGTSEAVKSKGKCCNLQRTVHKIDHQVETADSVRLQRVKGQNLVVAVIVSCSDERVVAAEKEEEKKLRNRGHGTVPCFPHSLPKSRAL